MRYSHGGMHRVLHAIGCAWLMPRPHHPKGQMVEDIARENPGQPIELWSQDEMRVGQKGTLTRVWAAKGERASAPRDLRFGYAFRGDAAFANPEIWECRLVRSSAIRRQRSEVSRLWVYAQSLRRRYPNADNQQQLLSQREYRRGDQEPCPYYADSDDVARSFRDHVARRSDMMSPA